MIEKMLLEYGKVKEQRNLLVSLLLSLMVKNFEDEEVNSFKVTLANKFIDKMFEDDGSIMLQDMTESIIFKSMETFLTKEQALLDIKIILNQIK